MIRSSLLDKIIIGIIFISIAFTTLAHGAVESWSVGALSILSLSALICWAIKGIVRKKLDLSIPSTAYPIAVFLLFGVIQSLTFPGENGQLTSFSLDPEATRSTVKILFFLLILHIVAANFIDNKERLRSLANFLVIFGFLVAVFALIQRFTWNGKIYWLIPSSGTIGLAGPFVNHNHFAGFMEMLIPLPIALILTKAVKSSRYIYGFAAVIMSVSVIMSLSRGGIISLFIGIMFTLALSLVYIRRRNKAQQDIFRSAEELWFNQLRKSLPVLAGAVLIIGGITVVTYFIGIDPVIERMTNNALIAEDENAQTFGDSRGWIWKTSMDMFFANPVYGVGLGAYKTIYPNFSGINDRVIIDRAHNDYIQVLTDTGIIGSVIALWFLLTVLFNIARGLRSKSTTNAGFAIGASGAILTMAIHSVFDFNLQLPSNALVFLVMSGVLSSISAKTFSYEVECAEKVIEEEEESVFALGVSS